LVLPMSGKF